MIRIIYILLATLFANHFLFSKSATQSDVVRANFSEREKAWWAIQPIRKNTLNFPANPVDFFIQEKLEPNELELSPQAGPYEFIRRASFDLIGLPPSESETEAFADSWKNNPETAKKELVEKLLASPTYGERWATHWLDVVRFAESDGYRADDFRSSAYLYRDYVIRSLNQDKPYDQFVREQLAGDEIDPKDFDHMIATGFLRHGVYEWNQRNARMQWELILNEMTNVTGEVFLGLGMGCAQCHDHKFDPILQKDYYSLQSFLSSVWWPEDQNIGQPDQLLKLQKWEAETVEVREKILELKKDILKGNERNVVKQFPADIQGMYYKKTEERTTHEQQLVEMVNRQVRQKGKRIKWEEKFKEELKKKYDDLNLQLASFSPKPSLPQAFITTDLSVRPARTFVPGKKKQETFPEFLSLLNLPSPKIEETKHGTTGRRLALANWITSPDNPLSTRVIVNRVWQKHFGQGLVTTANDFGFLGEPPSHPALLDFLSNYLVENDWKLKSLHRLIMLSDTYGQTARQEPSDKASLQDPQNQLLWRFPPRRLSAEQIRDAMLLTSGELKTKSGGNSVDGNSPHRSVYVKKKRNSPDRILYAFDAPAGFSSSSERLDTTTSTQALLLRNNPWPHARAQAMAKKFAKSESTKSTISKIFKSAYARPATQAEIELSQSFLDQWLNNQGPNKEPQVIETKTDKSIDHLSLYENTPRIYQKKGIELGSNWTIEAITRLDHIHANAYVNTLLSQWSGSHQKAGWTFGITSAKSAYEPRNFIMQLIGENIGGDTIYRVIDSNLQIPLGKTHYLSCSVTLSPKGDSHVHFVWKDLETPDSKVQEARIKHDIIALQSVSSDKLFLGGRSTGQHFWNGNIKRFRISSPAISQEHSLISKNNKAPDQGAAKLDLNFAKSPNQVLQDTGFLPRTTPQKTSSPQTEALAALCHVILTSNEFLYLH